MNTGFHLDFRILELKSPHGYSAGPSESIQSEMIDYTTRSSPVSVCSGFVT